MKRIRELARDWEESEAQTPRDHEVTIKVTTHDYARLCALAEIYQHQGGQKVWGDLISAALDEVEEAFPYIKGNQVVGEDELGDPLYADTGLTPRFQELTRKYSEKP